MYMYINMKVIACRVQERKQPLERCEMLIVRDLNQTQVLGGAAGALN